MPKNMYNGHLREQRYCSLYVTSSGGGRAVLTSSARTRPARDAHWCTVKTQFIVLQECKWCPSTLQGMRIGVAVTRSPLRTESLDEKRMHELGS